VLDFGMAKRADGQADGWSDGTLTEEGTVVGTARYMSPEQASGQPVDHRTDIFSLGIVLFEMATGSYPFRGRNSIQVLSSILRDSPPRPTTLRRSLPTRVGALIERCLEKEPGDRPQSADEVREQLELLRGEGGGQELEVEVVQTWAQPRVDARVLGVSSSGRSTAIPGSSPALAVLPLSDLSGQPDYFADGLTEELINAVARIGSLRVISRQSVMRYRGSTKLLPEIARELGVDHVLEGTILRAGNRVRISLQLIRAEPEQHLWAERYERSLEDVLTVQSDVARAVATEIRVKLSPSDEARLVPAGPVSPEVLEAYLKGRFHWAKRSLEGLNLALGYFQKAIELDPRHAPSHAGHADTLALLAWLDVGKGLPVRAKAAARKALELDPNLAEAHISLGFTTYFFDWDWAAAERSFQRGLELAPNSANGHHWYWSLLLATGRPDEARREIRQAALLDPLSPIILTNRGVHYHMGRDYLQATGHLRKALELDPGFFAAHLCLWRTQELMGDYPAAAASFGRAMAAQGRGNLAASLADVGGRSAYGPAMERVADLIAAEPPPPPLPNDALAWLYLANGRRDRAMALLEDAFARRSPAVVWTAVAPDWDPLADEPRFRELIELLGLQRRPVPPPRHAR
jgi:TolB-like protein/Tfp pilus assembly protein PilF